MFYNDKNDTDFILFLLNIIFKDDYEKLIFIY